MRLINFLPPPFLFATLPLFIVAKKWQGDSVNVLIWISKFINCQDSTVYELCTLKFFFPSNSV
jgi:hypothetical protein